MLPPEERNAERQTLRPPNATTDLLTNYCHSYAQGSRWFACAHSWERGVVIKLHWALPPRRCSQPKAHAEKRLDEKLLGLSKAKLLIVDELGYLPLEPDAAHLFFQLVSRRYETGAMLITSNRSVAEWGTVFADPVVATAILDRLLHHSHVLTIRGDSYRLRAKRKSGLIKAPPAGDGAPVGSASLRPVTGPANMQPRS
jgi:hypothetical protein